VTGPRKRYLWAGRLKETVKCRETLDCIGVPLRCAGVIAAMREPIPHMGHSVREGGNLGRL
jgi:hypothetical protein